MPAPAARYRVRVPLDQARSFFVDGGEHQHLAAFSPDGSRIAIAAFGNGPASLWDVASGTRLAVLGIGGNAAAAAFSADGARVLTTERVFGLDQICTAIVWDRASATSLGSGASGRSGNFVVAWERVELGDVAARRFDSTGAGLGTEFIVNAYTTGSQLEPDLACDASGNFLVVWKSFHDGGGEGVSAQRFASGGARAGTEFQFECAHDRRAGIPRGLLRHRLGLRCPVAEPVAGRPGPARRVRPPLRFRRGPGTRVPGQRGHDRRPAELRRCLRGRRRLRRDLFGGSFRHLPGLHAALRFHRATTSIPPSSPTRR